MWSVLVIVVLIVVLNHAWHMTWVATNDGTKYYVKKSVNKKQAAEILHTLTKTLNRFVEGAADMYPMDERVENMQARWNGTLSEVASGSDIAYSLNKNSIHICLRGVTHDPQSLNTAMYVLLHEMAHIATNEYGHTDEYWENFRWILEVAEQLGVYRYQNFNSMDVTYCGRTLGNNVLNCVKENSCSSLL